MMVVLPEVYLNSGPSNKAQQNRHIFLCIESVAAPQRVYTSSKSTNRGIDCCDRSHPVVIHQCRVSVVACLSVKILAIAVFDPSFLLNGCNSECSRHSMFVRNSPKRPSLKLPNTANAALVPDLFWLFSGPAILNWIWLDQSESSMSREPSEVAQRRLTSSESC